MGMLGVTLGAAAAINMGDVGKNVGNNAYMLQENAEMVGALVGLIMVIIGLIKLSADRQMRASKTAAVGLIVVGSLLFATGTVTYIFLSSMVEDEARVEFETQYGVL